MPAPKSAKHSAPKSGRRRSRSKSITPLAAPEVDEEPEDHGLDHFLADLKTPKRDLACQQFKEVISSGVPPYSDHDWVVVVNALAHANTIESIELAVDILKGEYQYAGGQWHSQSKALRRIMEFLCDEPDFSAKSKQDIHRITGAYKALLERLEELTGAKDLCTRFWIALFQRPSVYFAKAVNSFDQHEYIDDADTDARMSFLHGLQGFLAKSHEPVFSDKRCWPDLNSAMSDCLELLLEEMEDGKMVAEEVSALVETCIAVDVRDPTSKEVTPHGAVIEKIMWSIDHNENDKYKSTLFEKNIQHILEWAMQESVENCKLPQIAGKPDCFGKLGQSCRDAVYHEVARNHPELLKNYGRDVIRIYKRYPAEDKVVRGIVDAYYHIADAVNDEFDLFFEDLFEYKGFPKHYYELLEAICGKETTLFTSQHISRLVTRMGTHEEDIPYILDILLAVTKNNTPIMQGRGKDYYGIAVGCDGGVEYQRENLEKTNEIMVWMAYASEDEAERVVTLMEDAYAANSRLKNGPAINDLLMTWQKIAQVYKKPFQSRSELIDGWANKLETQEEAKRLQKSISGSGACSIQ